MTAYKSFLAEIGCLLPAGGDFSTRTDGVNDEVAVIAGPQLVAPVDNARYALNAANARRGSLYDALYATDVIAEVEGCKRTAKYNPVRGMTHWRAYHRSPTISPEAKWRVVREADSYQG
ncbi:hypothetical protein [Candidatus Spongiihabitans sp.]|uniref:hypothetical protein n=1 Tax=Candidatus Spongiihabitans sp. TaxID=3101308 RepID=UPI003C6FE366